VARPPRPSVNLQNPFTFEPTGRPPRPQMGRAPRRPGRRGPGAKRTGRGLGRGGAGGRAAGRQTTKHLLRFLPNTSISSFLFAIILQLNCNAGEPGERGGRTCGRGGPRGEGRRARRPEARRRSCAAHARRARGSARGGGARGVAFEHRSCSSEAQRETRQERSRAGDAVRLSSPPPSPPSRTKWTRLVHPSVLIGHVSSTCPRTRNESDGAGRGGHLNQLAAARGRAALRHLLHQRGGLGDLRRREGGGATCQKSAAGGGGAQAWRATRVARPGRAPPAFGERGGRLAGYSRRAEQVRPPPPGGEGAAFANEATAASSGERSTGGGAAASAARRRAHCAWQPCALSSSFLRSATYVRSACRPRARPSAPPSPPRSLLCALVRHGPAQQLSRSLPPAAFRAGASAPRAGPRAGER